MSKKSVNKEATKKNIFNKINNTFGYGISDMEKFDKECEKVSFLKEAAEFVSVEVIYN